MVILKINSKLDFKLTNYENYNSDKWCYRLRCLIIYIIQVNMSAVGIMV